MADGGAQRAWSFPAPAPAIGLRPGEISIDLFAGGGGASEAIREATGEEPAVAVNHDEWAIGMHAVNHPLTHHVRDDVYHAHPIRLVRGRRVGILHASPDCTHFSQAKGGQPRDRKIRALVWAVLKWAGMLARVGCAPRIITIENVVQMLHAGPLIAKRCPRTGRVVTLDMVLDASTGKLVHRVADRGERVPLQLQYLIPDKRRLGQHWRQFVAALRGLGYVVEWRALVSSDYGADTDRKRLYVIARRDGEPIRWPQATHGPRGTAPQGAAANIIDWSVLGTSIFGRRRPLTRNTIRRLLDGAQRGGWPRQYIAALEALRDGRTPQLDITPDEASEIAERFGHDPVGLVMATGGGGVARDVSRPLPTIMAGINGIAPHFIRPVIVHKHRSAGGRQARPVDEPLPTIATRGAGHLSIPMLLGTQGTARAKDVLVPVPTITTGGAANTKRPGCARPQLVEPIIAPYYSSGSGRTGQAVSDPLPTITTKPRHWLVEPVVISTCNSSSRGVRLASDPVRTITTAKGGDQAVAEPVVVGYRIDILYRMLFERELFDAQGFRPSYVIDRTADGRKITRTQAIRMVGNSVSPPPLTALLRANLDTADEPLKAVA